MATYSGRWDSLIQSKASFAALGLVTHGLLNNSEADYKFYAIIPLWTQLFVLGILVEYFIGGGPQSFLQAILQVARAAVVYFGTLIASVLTYRAFFHRLRKFPGPLLARVTKLYAVRVTLNGPYYEEIERLHRKHGPFVRTGPRELSIADADAIPLLYGPQARATKGPWYDHSKHIEGAALHTTRDKAEHKQKRKDWDRALGASSLREYSPRINRHTTELISQLALRSENDGRQKIRISDWMSFYSGDVIGDIGFSREFGMIREGKRAELVQKLHDSMPAASILYHLPWLVGLMTRTGAEAGAKDLFEFMNWAREALKERKKNEPQEKDIMSFLLEDDDPKIPQDRNADARVIIVAGMDTTASTLTFLMYELCKHSSIQAKLREEVQRVAGERLFLDVDDLNSVQYLEDVVNETLRLHPAASSGVQRETPPEGLSVNGTYIPGNVLTWMPIYTLHRSAEYFPQPLSFIPERWSTQPDLIQKKQAFMPFLTGPYKCVGWQLAMRELKSVTANLVLNFRIEFVDGDAGKSVETEARDCFATMSGPLDVVLRAWKQL